MVAKKRKLAKRMVGRPPTDESSPDNAPIRLLEVAGREFAQKGFDGASFREIADAAGVSFSLIAYHFGSKEKLWRAAIEYFSDKGKRALTAAQEEMPASRKDFDAWLRRFLHTGLLIAFEDPVLYRISMHAALSNKKSDHDQLPPLVSQGLFKEVAKTFSGASTAIKHVAPGEAQYLFRAMINMHVVAPFELELITGHDSSSAAAVDHQVELLVSIFYNGKGVDVRSGDHMKPRRRSPLIQPREVADGDVPSSSYGSDPRSPRGREVRERLIEAALRNFAWYGFEGASVRTIANDAKVAYPLVIYHFGSKEQLWEAAIGQIFAARISRVREVIAGTQVEGAGQLKKVLAQLLMEAAEKPELRKILILEQFAGSQRYENVLKPMAAEFVAAIAALSQQLVEGKVVTRFSRSDTQLLIISVFLCNSVLPDMARIALGATGKDSTVQRVAEFLVSLLTKGHGL